MANRPDSLAQLIQALTALPDLDDVERIRAYPILIDDAKRVLSAERAADILKATDRANPNRISQVDLAAQLGLSRTAVTAAIKQARTARKDQP
jgi:DNA-binding MarR family transcriptional regulator